MNGGPADLILTGGRVLVLDAAFTVARAVAVRGGRVLAAGGDAEIERLAGPATRRIALDGRSVLPGLIDTHCHFEDAGIAEDTVSFAGARTIAEAAGRVRAAAGRTPPGEWIRGQVWHPVSQLAEGRRPTAAELDSATTAHPVHLPIGHSCVVNSTALRLAGIGRDTPDPPGGTIERDPVTGEPTGVLEAGAQRLVTDVIPPWPPERRAAQFVRAMRRLNELGLTGVVAGATTPEDLAVLRRLRDEGRMTARVAVMVTPTGELNPTTDLAGWAAWFAQNPAPDERDPWLREAGIKLQADGGMTLRTAAVTEPYEGGGLGLPAAEPERLTALVKTAAAHGWRVGVHAVGDAAIDTVLDAYEAAHAEHDIAGRRFVLVHASLIRPDQMRRARALGVLAAAQSVFLWDKARAIRANLGAARTARAVPLRTMIAEMGIGGVCAGTDFPVNPLDPMINIHVMTTRRDVHGERHGVEEAVSMQDAIRLYTTAAARYTFEEDVRGSLEPGRLADLVVLSGDILETADVRGLHADLTVVGGEVVHDRLGALAPVAR
ncbi:hypothetical protein HNP84_003343 [Thermocatellispora tengchongensis]|uniref:Amidohydrolase 3 domain-containing protein n=1 Tax=Thermocatellispora tengchongensis TaxID=1073253 RepID=A0A840P8S6_9ACTN|nr:amidohydrolase [Thermocatellispora tengchongensis]MBB5133617.1 hypothetical protein [Thermocatellispora tengchongensis]